MAQQTLASSTTTDQVHSYRIWQVIAASAVGTMIEWYDFYIFGSLTVIIAPLFYPEGNDTLAQLAYLSTFAVGFIVRPFGALFFGRIGDLVGRKYAFLVTLLIMGIATAAIGFLPTYATIGIVAPIILLVIRVLQGLALGGEYGGAAVFVAEHVPDERRGFYTSFIQITATLGLFISLAVIVIVQNLMSVAEFRAWGWRSAASMAARRPTSPSTRPTASAASRPRGSRRPPRSASSSHSQSSCTSARRWPPQTSRALAGATRS